MVTTLEYDIKLNIIRIYIFYDNAAAFNLRIVLVTASKSTKVGCRYATHLSDRAKYDPTVLPIDTILRHNVIKIILER